MSQKEALYNWKNTFSLTLYTGYSPDRGCPPWTPDCYLLHQNKLFQRYTNFVVIFKGNKMDAWTIHNAWTNEFRGPGENTELNVLKVWEFWTGKIVKAFWAFIRIYFKLWVIANNDFIKMYYHQYVKRVYIRVYHMYKLYRIIHFNVLTWWTT